MDIWLETGVIFNLNHSVNGSRWCFTRKGRWVVLVSPSSCCILAQESRTNIHKRSRKYHNNRCASKCVKGNHYTNMKPRSRCILVLFSVNTNEWAQSWDKNTWSHLDSWRYWRKLKENFILPVFILTEYPAPPHTHTKQPPIFLQSGLFLTLGQFLPITHAFILLKIMCLF